MMTVDKSYENFKMAEPSSPPDEKSKKNENHEKQDTDTNEIMDQQIWQDFPEYLFEDVVARLPITSFFRFRTVCRQWNSMIESESFSQIYSLRNPQTVPCFYTITNLNFHLGAIYDPSSKKWLHPMRSFEPRKMLLPVASAGGLVCFISGVPQKFYVCNPLTRSFRELPTGLSVPWCPIAVGMILNGKSTREGYKVIWVQNKGKYQVYDSLENSWTKSGSTPPGIDIWLSLKARFQPVSTGTNFYFLLKYPEGILSYDVVSGAWKQFIIPAPFPMEKGNYMLAECNGQFMLVGLLTKPATNSVVVWELEKMTMLWKEVDSMPDAMCLEFYGRELTMSCMGNKGCLLMLCFRCRKKDRLVMYNTITKEWVRVPECQSPIDRSWNACGTAFHPCLTAVA